MHQNNTGVNKLIRFAKEKRVTLHFFKLDLKSLKAVNLWDASFSGNCDPTSQLGYIVFVGESRNYFIPLLFKSYEAHRAARSVMGAEMIVFCDMFDAALALQNEPQVLHPGNEMSLSLLTDSKTLFDILSKGTRTSEKRPMLDMARAREGFRNKEINDIGLIQSENNFVDSLTKMMSQFKLQAILLSKIQDVQVEQ